MEIIKYNKSIIKKSYAKIVTRKEKDELVEEFKKDCENYNKKSTAFSYSMALLLAQNIDDNQLISDVLLGELLRLFDKGTEIPIEGTYGDIENELFDSMHRIQRKYEGKIKRSILDIIYNDSINRAQYYSGRNDNKYNLIDYIDKNQQGNKWYFNFITSNAPVEHRVDIYKHILSSMSMLNLDAFIKYVEDKSNKKKFDEINTYINKNETILWDFFESIIGSDMSNANTALLIQKSKLLNFNNAKNEDNDSPEAYIRKNINKYPKNLYKSLDLWIEMFNSIEDNEDKYFKEKIINDMIFELCMEPVAIRNLLHKADFVTDKQYGSFLCRELLLHNKELAFYMSYSSICDYMHEIQAGLYWKRDESKSNEEIQQITECINAITETFKHYIDVQKQLTETEETYDKIKEEGRKAFTTLIHSVYEDVHKREKDKTLLKNIDFKN